MGWDIGLDLSTRLLASDLGQLTYLRKRAL